MKHSPHAIVTGGAGFIGSHVVERLLEEGWTVTNVDNFTEQHGTEPRTHNGNVYALHPQYRELRVDVRDLPALRTHFNGMRVDAIVHLAAMAGSRLSIAVPLAYQEVNVLGTQNMLELARELGVRHFVFASSSSVYGTCKNVPYRETERTQTPINPYAATKISGELLGHVYAHLYGLRFIALRLFTVYGPRQRPDSVVHKFARLMLEGAALPVYGSGNSCRDYTYIDEVVDVFLAAMEYDASPYEVVNVGGNRATSLLEMIEVLEDVLNVRARIERLPEQFGDVPYSCADVALARELFGFNPRTPLYDGISRFTTWLRQPDQLTPT